MHIIKQIWIRITIAIILFILAILRDLLPDVIRLPKFHFDTLSTILILISLYLLFHKWILIRILLLKKIEANWLIKIFIVVLCLTIIIFKIFDKNFTFDNTSLYLLLIIVAVIIIPDIKEFLLRIKKFKKGDLEIELDEEIGKFKEKIEKVEEKIEETPSPKVNYDQNEHVINKLIASDPSKMLWIIASEIEQRIIKLSKEANLYSGEKYISPTKLLNELKNHDLIPNEIIPLFRGFWNIRNKIAHEYVLEFDEPRLYEIVELGMKLLSLLPMSVRIYDN